MQASRSTCLIGLIGTGIQRSFAPELHMVEGEQQGLRHIYRLIDLTVLGLDVSALQSLVEAAERMGYNGLAVTHPCKQAVMPFLTELSPQARDLSAVNTVLFKNGQRIGHNTDWAGFARSFREDLGQVSRERVVQLGAGGAGSAVAHAALVEGVEHLTLFDIEPQRAAAVVERLAARFGSHRVQLGEQLASAVQAADGLINATPIGMVAHPGMPLPADLLRKDLWVADVIYFPHETALLRDARALGAPTMNGGGMVVFQAAEQFRLFTGLEPDVDRMRRHFAALSRQG